MNGIRFWARRSFCRIALMLGFFCFLEVVWRQVVSTTIPNYEFPWGHYDISIAAVGALFLFLGWFTYIPPAKADGGTLVPSAGSGDARPQPPSKKSG